MQRAVVLTCIAWLWSAGTVVRAELPADRLLRSLQPSADVNDFAGVLTPAEKSALEGLCRQQRDKSGAQISVVTLKSLEGGQIDDFAVKLFERWGIGQKGQNNGILLLVAIQDRKARMEVGYGLEPILPDALAGQIVVEELFPAFKRERYAEGLQAALKRVAAVLEKNEPAPANLRAPRRHDNFQNVLLLSLFLAMGSFVLGSSLSKPRGSQIAFCLIAIAVPFFVGFIAAFPWAPIMHVPLGILFGWFGWKSRNGTGRRGWTRSPGGTTSPWGWDLGNSGWSGGGFSGGGGDWGGFGGGRSGGGGASGGW